MKIDIVGGGLSGLSATISLKEKNKKIDVTVYEKYKEIGYNFEGRRCGEAHTLSDEWDKIKPRKKDIFDEVRKAEIYVGKKKFEINSPKDSGVILNRQEFISRLGKIAIKKGAEIKTNSKIKSIDELNGDYIIDASGCPSTIKKELGIDKGKKSNSYQQTLKNCNVFDSKTVKLYYSSNIGYYWVFPRNPKYKEVNVGLGFYKTPKVDLKNMLEDFKEKHNIDGEIDHISGGLIPMGLQKPFMHKNILFVGDSCVGTFPLTGEGIYRALLSGNIAGKCIAKNKVNSYPRIITREFIKWDIICRTYFFTFEVLRNINKNLVLYLVGKFLDKNLTPIT